jgi:hypothetical protein
MRSPLGIRIGAHTLDVHRVARRLSRLTPNFVPKSMVWMKNVSPPVVRSAVQNKHDQRPYVVLWW